jgi:hypothetical protein
MNIAAGRTEAQIEKGPRAPYDPRPQGRYCRRALPSAASGSSPTSEQTAPDLLEMTPTEFEHLVRQLFEKMGMKSWVTQASKDDGVDATPELKQ